MPAVKVETTVTIELPEGWSVEGPGTGAESLSPWKLIGTLELAAALRDELAVVRRRRRTDAGKPRGRRKAKAPAELVDTKELEG